MPAPPGAGNRPVKTAFSSSPRTRRHKHLFNLLDSRSTSGFSIDAEVKPADIDASRGTVLLCAACRHLVTRKECATEISGNTLHTFTNPHGYTYTFRTFTDAPGCTRSGEPTAEHTWFPGHAWQMASCRGCGEHLGWGFSGASGATFYGLIDDRLIEDQLQ
jgi:hypothetical protein